MPWKYFFLLICPYLLFLNTHSVFLLSGFFGVGLFVGFFQLVGWGHFVCLVLILFWGLFLCLFVCLKFFWGGLIGCFFYWLNGFSLKFHSMRMWIKLLSRCLQHDLICRIVFLWSNTISYCIVKTSEVTQNWTTKQQWSLCSLFQVNSFETKNVRICQVKRSEPAEISWGVNKSRFRVLHQC